MERHSISKGWKPKTTISLKPKTTQRRYSDIGVLDLPTGYLEIHDGVINFLKAQEVWSDFNSPEEREERSKFPSSKKSRAQNRH